MIAQDKPKPTLTWCDYRTMFHMLLKQVGGMGFKASLLKTYPMQNDVKWEARYDYKRDVWEVYIPKESSPKKGIVTSVKKLILPGDPN